MKAFWSKVNNAGIFERLDPPGRKFYLEWEGFLFNFYYFSFFNFFCIIFGTFLLGLGRYQELNFSYFSLSKACGFACLKIFLSK